MNSTEVFSAAARLHGEGIAYAMVTVVRAEAPTSSRPGDKAIVTADGRIQGWIGGGCAQPAVVKTVRQAILDGKARLIRVAPTGEGEREIGDILEFGMACHSGGTLELFIDPMRPQPQLLIFGASPVAVNLAHLAPRLDFAVSVVAPMAGHVGFPESMEIIDTDDAVQLTARIAPNAYVVVATQGQRDLQALNAALALDACYVAFVAIRKKAGVLKDSLLAGGADPQAVAAIVAPAGYPISATTPEEIALSVLAALVARRRGGTVTPALLPVEVEVEAEEKQTQPAKPLAATVGGGCCSH